MNKNFSDDVVQLVGTNVSSVLDVVLSEDILGSSDGTARENEVSWNVVDWNSAVIGVNGHGANGMRVVDWGATELSGAVSGSVAGLAGVALVLVNSNCGAVELLRSV